MERRGHRRSKAVALGAAGAFTLLGATSSGRAAEAPQPAPTQQELLDEIKALRAEVRDVKVLRSRIDELEAERAERTRADAAARREQAQTAEAVRDDAARRSQLMQAEGFTAGYNKGRFLIQSADGNFVLNPNFQFQFRYVGNYRSEVDPNDGGESAAESGFEVSRMKFAFEGNAFSPAVTYKFQFAATTGQGDPQRPTLRPVLEDAWVRYQFAPAFAVRGGQFKDPWTHEETVDSKRQLAVDRSVLNELLGGGRTDRVQGVGLIWDDGDAGSPLRAEVAFTDGPNTESTTFTDEAGVEEFGAGAPDWGLTGRVDYLAFGDWRAYDDLTAMDNREDLLALGAGVSYAETGGADLIFHTVDAQYERGPMVLYAAYVGVYSEGEEDYVAGGAYDWGALVQGGYLLSDRLEAFGRYGFTQLDRDRIALGGESSIHELTGGVNYYLRGHAAKFTLDLTYLPNGSPSDLPVLGILESPDGGSQTIARGQFQLLL